MKFKNIVPSHLLAYLTVACLYPLYRVLSAETNKLLHLINSLTIVGGVFLILGVIASFVLHGDTDITAFVLKRTLFPKKTKDYDSYKQDREEERESSFNYPLFTGILMIAAAVILTFVYNRLMLV